MAALSAFREKDDISLCTSTSDTNGSSNITFMVTGFEWVNSRGRDQFIVLKSILHLVLESCI